MTEKEAFITLRPETVSPRVLDGSLDPWTVEDDCITMESNLMDQLRSKLETCSVNERDMFVFI